MDGESPLTPGYGATRANVTGKVPTKYKRHRHKAGKPVKLSDDGKRNLKRLERAGHISPKAASVTGLAGNRK